MGISWAQLLIQFYTNLFETLHVFSIVWRCACALDIIVALIFVTFSTLWTFCHFLTSDSTKVYRQWVPCERNSSYNFIPMFLKHCTCFLHSLEMCMWFGYNPCINFCHFFYFVNFVIFWLQILWKCIDSGYLVSATPYTIPILSSCNFAHLFFHGLKMCMWFGFNFCHFSTLLFFSFSQVQNQLHRSLICIILHEILLKCIDSGYIVGTTPLIVFFWLFWNYADVFSMKWRCACSLGIILYFFSLLLLCELKSLFFYMKCYRSI